MKRKQVYLLLGIALALTIAGTIFQLTQSSSWKEEAGNRQIYADLAVNDVAKIKAQTDKGNLTLERSGDVWQVADRYGYPADFSKIRDLLRSFWELKYVRILEVGPSQFGRLQLLSPGQGDQSGTEIDLLGTGDKKIATLILGKKPSSDENSIGSGRFAFDPDQKGRVYLIDETFSSLDPLNPSGWLNKEFIDTQKLRSVVRGNVGKAPGWRVSRKDDHADWQLDDAAPDETLDKEKVTSLSSLSLSFQDVRPENTPANESGFQQPLVAELETFDGFHYQLQIGGAAPEQTHFVRVKVSANLPAARTPVPNESPEDKKKKDEEFSGQLEQWKTRLGNEKKLENWIFLVTDWSLEPLMKGRTDLLKAAEASPTPQATPAATPAGSPGAAAISPSPVTNSATGTPNAPVSPSPSPASTASPTETPNAAVSPSPSPAPTTSSQ